MSTPYATPSAGVWNTGVGTGQQNVWNSSVNDGSVPWSQIFAGQQPGASILNSQIPTSPGATAWGGGGGIGGGGGGGGGPGYAPNTGNDAYLNSALSRLQQSATGQVQPFDATTRTNMLSKASDMNAAAESSNAQDVQARVAASGGSMSDPATQAALAQLKSGRQQSNVTAAQGIDSQANLANYSAQNQAAGNLADTRLRQASVDPNYNGAASTVGAAGVTPAPTGGGGPTATATAGASTGQTVNPATGGVMNADGSYVGHPSWWRPLAQQIPNQSYGWQSGSGFGSTSRGSATLAG